MEDKELEQLSRDPRYTGKLRKTSKNDKEAWKDLFSGVEEETAFKDKRGRPWPKKPIKYAKKLIEEEKKESSADESEPDSSSESESDSASSDDGAEEHLADLQDADWYALVGEAEEAQASTRRLAILHFDWDNVNAEAIFIALESFLPPGKCLEKVTVCGDF